MEARLMIEPTWVTLLFDRGHGCWSTRGPTGLAFLRELISGHTGGDDSQLAHLRAASLRRLDDDPHQALGFLAVAGIASDLAIVSRFLNSPNEAIQNSAKLCRFELIHHRRD